MSVVLPPATPQPYGVCNLQLSNTRKLRKAIATALAGVSGSVPAGVIACVGDSTTRGGGATAISNCWPNVLAGLLAKAGIPARTDGFWGASNFSTLAAFTTFEPRVVGGTGWALTQRTAGGQMIRWPGALSPTALAFTPTNSYNQVDVYYVSNTGFATMNVDRGGVSPTSGGTSINMNAALGAHKATFGWSSVASGAFNITDASSGAGAAFIIGVVARDTTAPHLDILNMGWAGSNSADWVATTFSPSYDPVTLLKLLAPAVTIIGHAVNDWNSGTSDGGNVSPTSLANYTSNIQSLITAAQISGDVILADGPQSDPSAWASLASQASYQAALQSLSASNNVPYWERQTVLGTYANSNADSLQYDGRHPNNTGLALEAREMLRLFTQY